MLGTTELLLLGGLALLVFGGKKVPEMMRGLGQGVKEFKKGMREDVENTPNDNNAKPDIEENEKAQSSEEKEEQNNAEQQR
mgnify:FL=1